MEVDKSSNTSIPASTAHSLTPCLLGLIICCVHATTASRWRNGNESQVPGVAFGDTLDFILWVLAIWEMALSWYHGALLTIGFRLWVLLDFACACLRARTEITALTGGTAGDPKIAMLKVAVVVPIGALATWVMLTPTAERGPIFDPASAIPPDPDADTKAEDLPPPGEKVSGEFGASLAGKLLISWINPLLTVGRYHPLQKEMLFDLVGDDNPAHNANEIHVKLTAEVANSPQPSLLRVLIRMFHHTWLLSALLMFCSTLLNLTGPLLLNELIQYFDTAPSFTYGSLLAAGIFLQPLISGLLASHSNLLLYRIAMRSRSALKSVVYAKALVLAQSARVQFSDGQITNLMQVDAMHITNAADMLHEIWNIPLMFLGCMYFLYQQLGVACVGSLGVMLLLSPINMLIMRFYLKYCQTTMVQRDKRVKLLTEVLEGIKIVKYFGLEPRMRDKIGEARLKEVTTIAYGRYIVNLCAFLCSVTPSLISVLCFGLYTWLGGELSVAKAFTCISLFNMLESPISQGPMIIEFIIELSISLKRLLAFLLAEEVHVHNVSNFPEDAPDRGYCRAPGEQAGVMIWIKDGSFRWREGKVHKEERKARLDAETEALRSRIKTAKKRDMETLAAKATKLEKAVVDIQAQLALCGNSALLPVHGPPTLQDIDLRFPTGTITAIVGKVGSGKSTVLSALLNEVTIEKGAVFVAGRVSYCAQQPWITQGTVRDNILWGSTYDEDWYQEVLSCCALEDDLPRLPGGQGDLTEIGEKGLNLSGGQKSRIALARAVYSNADVLLLDDVLSAVDPMVAAHIMENCVLGLLKGKTRILVTHHPRWLSVMDSIVVMESGQVVMAGTYDELIEKGFEESIVEAPLPDDMPDIPELLDSPLTSPPSSGYRPNHSAHHNLSFAALSHVPIVETRTGSPPTSFCRRLSGFTETGSVDSHHHRHLHGGFLIEAEDRETGGVSIAVWDLYLRTIGRPLTTLLVVLFLAAAGAQVGGNWFLQYWSERIQGTRSHSPWVYMVTYSLILAGGSVLVYARSTAFLVSNLRLARRMHDRALWAVLRCPMSYFETTIKGRIINRFSIDLENVDVWLQYAMSYLLTTAIQSAASIAVVVANIPAVAGAFVVLGAFYVRVMNYFRCSTRELQRLDSHGASPVYGHFGETLSGVSTIRGFGAEAIMQEKNLRLLQGALAPAFHQDVCAAWLKVRLQFMGSLVVLGVAVSALVIHSWNPDSSLAGMLGLSLLYALDLTSHLSDSVFAFTTAETSLVAVERLSKFADLPPEAPLALNSDPPVDEWPGEGTLEFVDVVMRYRKGLDPVLKGLSFKVRSGERVGVVGRTGAGKSSILVALFRLAEIRYGVILIDGVPIQSVGLHTLRTRIAIIPQEPVLFSGTLRFNLDPCDKHTSEEIWRTLEVAHLKDFVLSRSEGLDMPIEPGGANLSVGQRQLVCMVRAMLLGAKVLLLDEATASVDMATDRLIQNTLRELKGVTTLTIAHRINTILDSDRVLVLDNGQAVEYDNPRTLIATPGSVFGQIVASFQAEPLMSPTDNGDATEFE